MCFVEDVLRIEAAQRAEAECIADALAAYDASVEPNGALVIVAGMGSGTLLTAVLDALKACLDANAIAAVKVSIDDQHYCADRRARARLRGAPRELEPCPGAWPRFGSGDA